MVKYAGTRVLAIVERTAKLFIRNKTQHEIQQQQQGRRLDDRH